MLKFIKLLVIVLFVNAACINAGYSYALNNNEGSVFSIWNFISNQQDISVYNNNINVSKKVSSSVTNLFKSTGNILFDLGNIGSIFVGVNDTKSDTSETTIVSNKNIQNCDIRSFAEHKQDLILTQVKVDKSKINLDVNAINFVYKNNSENLGYDIHRYKNFVDMYSWQNLRLLLVMTSKFASDYISLNTNFCFVI